MIEFLEESETFNGITFSGCYDMPISHFEQLYNHYKKTGDNLLDAYSNMIHTSWDGDSPILIDGNQYNKRMQNVSKIRRLKLFDTDFVYKVINILDNQYQRYRSYNSRERVRRKASCYTSKPEIRQKIFDIHGEVCLKCGGKDDIQLDHIVSVRRGGENSINNIQPLCKTCNIKKGTKTIDYR